MDVKASLEGQIGSRAVSFDAGRNRKSWASAAPFPPPVALQWIGAMSGKGPTIMQRPEDGSALRQQRQGAEVEVTPMQVVEVKIL